MKWIGRVLYVILVVIVSFFVFMISLAKKYDAFLNNNMKELKENYNREKAVATLMTDEINLTNYLKDPIYLATSNEENNQYDFGIYQFNFQYKEENMFITTMYFKAINIKVLEDLMADPKYKDNYNLLQIKIALFYDNSEDSVDKYISADFMQQKLFHFATIGENSAGNISYLYNQFNEENKPTLMTNQLISKIELSIVNKLGTEEEITPLVTINHNEANNNEGINEVINKEAPNFNGSLDYQMLEENYNNESLVGELLKDELNSYNKVAVRTNVIYYIILIIITYLIYFLKPTINYIKGKKVSKEITE